MLIMDRQGTLHATGLNIIYPELSQDGRWIGGTAETRSGAISGAVIAPRSGGAERVLAPGGEFLGWQNNRAVYTNGGYGSQLYALDPNTSAPILLGKLTSDESPELPRGEINSPDGQVLSLQLGRSEPMMLVGNQLLPLRNFGPWVGLTHDVMVIAPESDGSYSDYVIEDGPTGKVVRDTGVSSFYTGGVMAISGDWMVTSNGGTGQFLQLSLVNFDTKVSYTIDPTLSDIVPLGNSGEFLSVDTTNVTTNSNAREPTLQILIIDPALMR
jgi:hypothetical protein